MESANACRLQFLLTTQKFFLAIEQDFVIINLMM